MEKAVAPPKSLLTAWLAGAWIPWTVYLLVGLARQVQLPITWLKTSLECGEGKVLTSLEAASHLGTKKQREKGLRGVLVEPWGHLCQVCEGV